MKYVVMQVKTSSQGDLVLELPIIFPDVLVHADVAKAIAGIPGITATAVSAGFMSSLDLEPVCNGKSETLNLKSRGQADTGLIRMIDYTHGIV